MRVAVRGEGAEAAPEPQWGRSPALQLIQGESPGISGLFTYVYSSYWLLIGGYFSQYTQAGFAFFIA